MPMVISHRHRYLYFVVPKCASATIRQSLRDYTDVGYPVSKYPQHLTLRRFLASEHAGLLGQYFSFTFVRNPYDRLYSGFLQDRKAASTLPPWTEAKRAIFDVIGADFNRYMVNYVQHANLAAAWDWVCFCPMHEFAWLEGTRRVDWIGRAEDVAGGLAELGVRLGIPVKPAGPFNVNCDSTAPYKYLDRYERQTVSLVNDLYREDFVRFEYPMLDPAEFPIRLESGMS